MAARAVAIGMAVLALSACGRTSLWSPYRSETEGGTAGLGGGLATSGSGGSFSGSTSATTGGATTGGALGGGNVGGFGAGGVGLGGAQGGNPQGGNSPICMLAAKDCRLASETECERSSFPCLGDLLKSTIYPATVATVTELAAAGDGSVVASGVFQGMLSFGGDVGTLQASTEEDGTGQSGAAFIASFSAAGDVQWAYSLDGPGAQTPHGLGVASSGRVIAQVAGSSDSVNPSFVAAVDVDGVHWRYELGGSAAPTGVAVDNNDEIWVAGSFNTSLTYRDRALETTGNTSGYLLRIDENGDAIDAQPAKPASFVASQLTSLVIDDEDRLIISGAGNGIGGPRAYVQKRSKAGDVVFTKEWPYDVTALTPLRVAVDGKMRITVARSFDGSFVNEGTTFQAGQNSNDVWVAQYGSAGELLWQQAFSSAGTGAFTTALVTDPFDNLLLLGRADSLTVGAEIAQPLLEHGTYVEYVMKLRPDGQSAWLRWLDGNVVIGALASNSDGAPWLGGRATGHVWYYERAVDSQRAPGAFLLQLEP